MVPGEGGNVAEPMICVLQPVSSSWALQLAESCDYILASENYMSSLGQGN